MGQLIGTFGHDPTPHLHLDGIILCITVSISMRRPPLQQSCFSSVPAFSPDMISAYDLVVINGLVVTAADVL
jgi:hypothetical protein